MELFVTFLVLTVLFYAFSGDSIRSSLGHTDYTIETMGFKLRLSLLLSVSVSGLVAAVPAPVPVPTTPATLADRTIDRRAGSCTFTAASAASASKKSCATIVLDNIAVPSGTTLDMTGLTSGTHVGTFSIL